MNKGTSVYIDEEILLKVKKILKEKGTTLSRFVGMYLKQFLEEEERPKSI